MIILQFGGLFGAIKEAWHYVQSAVNREVASDVVSSVIKPITEALDDKDIDLYYNLYEEAIETWQQLTLIPEEYKITEDFSLSSPFDWRQQHVMKMKIQGIDINTGEIVDQWITVEADRELTKGEWLELGQEAVFDSPFGYSYEVQFVSEFEYYTKQ